MTFTTPDATAPAPRQCVITVDDEDRTDEPERPWTVMLFANDDKDDVLGSGIGATIADALRDLAASIDNETRSVIDAALHPPDTQALAPHVKKALGRSVLRGNVAGAGRAPVERH